MKLKTITLLGVCAGLLIGGGCAHVNPNRTRVMLDTKKIRNITQDPSITCSNITADFRFLDASTKYAAQSTLKWGNQCIIYFNPKELNAADLQSRGYVLHLYHNEQCVAAVFYGRKAKPFFSSAC